MSTWTPPQTEHEWDECFSAYIDGELLPEEATALETYIKERPEYAQRLAALRHVSEALAEWHVETPLPPEGLAHECMRLHRSRNGASVARKPGWQWLAVAASLVAGIVIGVAGTTAAHRTVTPLPPGPSGETVQSSPAAHMMASGADIISPRQAEALAKEVRARGMAADIERAIRRQNWQAALESYERLRECFPDASATQEIVDKYREFVSVARGL